MEVDAAVPASQMRAGSGSPFVQVNAESYPYTETAQAWLEEYQQSLRTTLRTSQPVFLIEGLLDLGQGAAAYPPLSAEERIALLGEAPSPLARAQATYYLLRDRALAEPALDLDAPFSPQAETHPSAVAWAVRNTLKLTRVQRAVVDALWLIDHGHLALGVDILIRVISANSKSSPLQALLPRDAVHQLFFRLAIHAEIERVEMAATLPPVLRNHAGANPLAAKRLVSFADAFQYAGVGKLFASESVSAQDAASLPHQALEAYLVSLCRLKGLGETWKWLNKRYGRTDGYVEFDKEGSIYASLLIAVIQSIASPKPLRGQLHEIISLPFSAADLQILDSYATAPPSTRANTISSSESRKARAVIAEVLFIRYIQSGRYSDALALDAQLELQSAQFEPGLFELPQTGPEEDELEARRKRRADLLRAAREVMPEVQRRLLDVRRVQTAVAAAGTAPPEKSKQSRTTEGSWQDVSHEDVMGEDGKRAGDGEDAEMDDGTASPHQEEAEQGNTSLVPLTSSAALRGQIPLEEAADLANQSSATAAAVVHASDPQAALISALVSNSVDVRGSASMALFGPRKSRTSFDVSLSAAPFRGNRSIGSMGGRAGDPNTSQLNSPMRQSPGPSLNPIRGSPFGSRGRSSLAGGAPSPASFGTPRRNVSSQLDAAATSEQSGSPGMHLAYLFRQPERRFVATVDIPLPSGGDRVGGASTEQWAAEQTLRLDTGLQQDESLLDSILPETPMDEEEDPANRTMKASGAASDDADTSVRMPGAWDAPAGGSNEQSKPRGLKKRGAGGRGNNSAEEGAVTRGGRSKRTRRAAGAPPPSPSPQPGPVSSTPTVKRTTTVLQQPSSRNPRARPPPPPSGLRRMTRASSVLSTSSSVTGEIITEGHGDENGSDDGEDAILNEMVEVEGNAPPTLLRLGAPNNDKGRSSRNTKRVVSTSTSATSAPRTRRSSRLASQEPDEGEEDDDDGGSATASQSETETETETEETERGDDGDFQVDETESESGRRSKQTRTRRAGGVGIKKAATTKASTTRSKAKKRA
ncbi:hypothetical protein A4X13_0g1943 [Tilletia indica]|uniref:ELYS-like domain-containing protein n=1 Tax=Tilletia indica TaxID=43049 RepID=A0A177TTQ4_9BASI|nr:hypothetical protein A4X13_0g1943 [Tilletia indica]